MSTAAQGAQNAVALRSPLDSRTNIGGANMELKLRVTAVTALRKELSCSILCAGPQAGFDGEGPFGTHRGRNGVITPRAAYGADRQGPLI